MLDVIGAGFGRTGTHSLARALDILGISPCYHMLEFQRHPEHLKFWQAALDGKIVDWKEFFKPYKATVEWPAVFFLHQLIVEFPESKVILTHRDPEEWFRSASETIFEGLELSEFNPDPAKAPKATFVRRLILQETFSGRHRDKQHAVGIYENHVEEVMKSVPTKRLLQFDVKNGWPPLCAFLGVDEPEVAFPWLNERSEMKDGEPEWAKDAKRMLAEREQKN